MRAHVPWIELSRPQVMLLLRERRQCASKASVGLQVACASACAWIMARVIARCAGKSVGGGSAAWSAISPRPLLTLSCLCVAQQQAVDYASLYKPQGGSSWLQRRGRSRWDPGSPSGQPGRAWSRVAATVMPCTRALCVRAGPGWRRCAEAAVGEFVGSR